MESSADDIASEGWPADKAGLTQKEEEPSEDKVEETQKEQPEPEAEEKKEKKNDVGSLAQVEKKAAAMKVASHLGQIEQ